MAVLRLDRVFHGLAAVLLADLVGFLLHEGREALDVAGDRLAGFFLCFGERLVEFLYLIMFGAGIGALDGERSLVSVFAVATAVAVAA